MDKQRTDLTPEENDTAALEMLEALGWPDFVPSWEWSEFNAEENARISRGMERVERCMRTYDGTYYPDAYLSVPREGWTHLARAWLTSPSVDEYDVPQLKVWFHGVMAATRTEWDAFLDCDPNYLNAREDDYQQYLLQLEEDAEARSRCMRQSLCEPLRGAPADWAREYAKRSWPVYPADPAGKPLVNTALQHVGSTDVTQITAWWDRWPNAQIALATGAATGWVAAEVPAEEALRAVLMLLPQRRFMVTRLNGSRLILFRVHTATGSMPSQRLDDPTTGTPLVIMHGDGDVVLLPPSRGARDNGR